MNPAQESYRYANNVHGNSFLNKQRKHVIKRIEYAEKRGKLRVLIRRELHPAILKHFKTLGYRFETDTEELYISWDQRNS